MIYTEDEDDTFIFNCSGRTFCANGGLVSIDSDGSLFGGFDHNLYPEKGDAFSWEEKKELADFMIRRWKKYAGKKKEHK